MLQGGKESLASTKLLHKFDLRPLFSFRTGGVVNMFRGSQALSFTTLLDQTEQRNYLRSLPPTGGVLGCQLQLHNVLPVELQHGDSLHEQPDNLRHEIIV